jgi:hypothetical protein
MANGNSGDYLFVSRTEEERDKFAMYKYLSKCKDRHKVSDDGLTSFNELLVRQISMVEGKR